MPLANKHSVVRHFSLPLDESQVEVWAAEQSRKMAGPVTFALLFCAPDAVEEAPEIQEIVRIYAQTPTVLGCSADGLIAGAREMEDGSGFCIALYHLPGTRAASVYLDEALLLDREADDIASRLATCSTMANGWLLFASAGNLSNDSWLAKWDRAVNGRTTIGGFSGNPSNGSTAMFADGKVYHHGAVAMALEGEVTIEPLLSQGCRPVGSPWTITRADQNIIHRIGNRPILEVLRDTLEGLNTSEQQQARGNIFIGLVMDEYKASFGTGDFLVRNLAAIDPNTGAVAIATPPRVGQNLQFQIRDATTASVDLEELLKRRLAEFGERKIFGACLCDCIGRGSALFGRSNHDVSVVRRHLPGMPLSGLFCNGEFAPVGGRTLLHGYAASLGIFVARSDSDLS